MRALLLAGLLAAGWTPALTAQSDPRVVAAVRLARDGLGDSARAVAGRLLARTNPADPFYPEALYTVAAVAADPGEKRLALQRLAVEFSASAWADDARLDLAQLDYAERNLEGVERNVERLLADYPLSPLRAAAALWGTRAAIERRELPLACQWATLGLNAVGDDLELRHQLEFQRQRCLAMTQTESTTARARPDTAGAPAPRTPPAARAPERAWFVQVAAFKQRGTAERVAARLERVKIPATVIADGGFFKVRAGPYSNAERAAAAVTAVRRQVGGRPFIVRPP